MKGSKRAKLESVNQENELQASWSHWTKAAVAFTLATGAYAVSKMVGVVWGGSEGALPSATSESDTDLQSDALTPLENNQPIHSYHVISPIEVTPIPLGGFSNGEHFELTPAYPAPTFSSSDLLFMAGLSLLQPRLSFPAQATAFILSQLEGGQAAFPTVANPIPPQYAEPGQPFSFDFDLNHIFNDTDQMTFGGVTQAGGSALPSWVKAEPIKLSGRPYANDAQDVQVVGDIAYIANGDYGLLLFNISNPANKVFLGSVDTPGDAYGVSVQSDVAFVADGGSGLQVINVSTPSAPALLGSYDTLGRAYGVTVQNDVALVVDSFSGLLVLDVSTPSAPALLGSVNTPGNAQGVTVQNGVVLVADGLSGLQVINVSTPSAPALLGSYNTPGNALGITVQNDLAFVADGLSGLLVLDVSTPSAPTLLGSYNTPGNAWGVTVQSGVALVADENSGLLVLDVSTPSAPTLLGSVDTPGNARGVTVQNNVALVADYGSGLQVINVGTPSAPTLLGNYTTPGDAYGVTVHNDVALVADGSSLQVINVSTPCAPTLLGSYNTPGNALGVIVQNDLVFVADWNSGLLVLDVSTPSAPTLLGSVNTPGTAWGVTVQNDVALVADGSSLQVINVSTPSAPTLLGSVDTPGDARGVTVQNDLAFVADDTSGLLVLDVSTPSAPTLLGSYNTPGDAWGVTVQNDVALVADGSSGLLVLDMSTPSAPALLGSVDTPGDAYGVTVHNDVAFVADGAGGLQIFDLGQTRLLGTLPTTAMGPYNFTLSAINEHGEWIATDFELRVGLAPTAPFSTTRSSPTTPPTASGSETQPNANTPSPSLPDSNRLSNPTIGNSQPSPGLIIVSIEVLYLEVGIETTLTTDHLSVSGFTGDPSQITYSIPLSEDYTVTVNGTVQYFFTQQDLQNGGISIRLEDSACFDYLNEIPVEVTDGTTTTGFNLLFIGDTASCAYAGASRQKSTESVVMLLVSSGLGMFAASRGAKEKVKQNLPVITEVDDEITEVTDEGQNMGCVNT